MPDTSIAGMAIPIVVAIRITQGIGNGPNRDLCLFLYSLFVLLCSLYSFVASHSTASFSVNSKIYIKLTMI